MAAAPLGIVSAQRSPYPTAQGLDELARTASYGEALTYHSFVYLSNVLSIIEPIK